MKAIFLIWTGGETDKDNSERDNDPVCRPILGYSAYQTDGNRLAQNPRESQQLKIGYPSH
ncbi:MAG: hypothetical protein CBE26_02940 [Kiritimatiellaceae bacterium TMED266]|nr:MAG: hypothetical protein CBE26_02940 [Kiritimatiellaceae bacterium TMED266]